ncbi:MAG: hypothetical protein MUF19_00220 [Candidatus Pacebacteria bacterium]|jgi:hypothetical protein|nr:hypothetical protein [Candidatus Paceibacterota bacterium]
METFNVVPLLQIGFYLVAIVYAIFSAVLFYHWQSYSMSTTVTAQTYLAYAICSLPLLAIMAVIALF